MSIKVFKYWILSALFFISASFLISSPQVQAGEPETYIYNLTINDKIKNIDPPALIYTDRTLVPLRFVIEDEFLKGQIFWDEALRKAAVECQGKYFEFFIDNPVVRVDQKSFYLDTAPVIYQDRIYIPLRFLAEHLNAVVNWEPSAKFISIILPAPDNEQKNEEEDRLNEAGQGTSADAEDNVLGSQASVYGDSREVFAYYYRSPSDELERCLNLCTTVAFRWLETNAQGDLFYEYDDQYDKILAKVKNRGKAVQASVALMKADALHELLSVKENRARLIAALTKLAYEKGYDGINIDFESIRNADRDNFSTFLSELKTALGRDKLLSVAVFARTAADTWGTPYDYPAIGGIADQVIVMAYDYSYVNSDPGPIAPLWWVQNVADYMEKQMDRKKIILGVPTYGYDWPEDSSGSTVTLNRLNKIMQTYKVQSDFDLKSQSPYHTYYDENGVYHEIWMENRQSLTAKIDLSLQKQLGGIAFWRIGTGFDDLYKILENKRPLPAVFYDMLPRYPVIRYF
ncbi:MAG: hypothetical protein LBR98_03840 [Syntrophomonadaceae bacterium]|nr:hypothetical protein [Syntrophomonadaceae bacterium]